MPVLYTSLKKIILGLFCTPEVKQVWIVVKINIS